MEMGFRQHASNWGLNDLTTRKKQSFTGCRALMLVFCLMTVLTARAGDDACSVTNPLPAEQYILDHLTNSWIIDVASNPPAAEIIGNRVIHGDFLEKLLCRSGSLLSHDGLRLQHAVVAGPVDLGFEQVPVPVTFVCCHFTDRVKLADTHFAHNLSFTGCVFDTNVYAAGLRIDGSLKLKTYALGTGWDTASNVPPSMAEIERFLDTDNVVKYWAPEHGAFVGDSNQTVRCWRITDPRSTGDRPSWINGFEAKSWGTNLWLAENYDEPVNQSSNGIVGLTFGPLTDWMPLATNEFLNLDLIRTNLANPISDAEAITAAVTNLITYIRWTFIDQSNPLAPPVTVVWDQGTSHVSLFQHTVIRGMLWVDQAVLGGTWDSSEVEFKQGLSAHSLNVGDSLLMCLAEVDGTANFTFAQIGHDFCINESRWPFFNGSGLKIGGSFLMDHARFGNGIVLPDVSVGMDFLAPFARFENPGAPVVFNGLKVTGQVDLQRAQFKGPADFILMSVGGNFQVPGASFEDARGFDDLRRTTGNSFTFNTDFGSMRVDGFAIFENVMFARSVSFRSARLASIYLDNTHWPKPALLAGYTNAPKSNEVLRLEGMDFQNIRDVASSRFEHSRVQLDESRTNLLAMFARRSPYSFDVYDKLQSYFLREGAPDLADDVYVSAKTREGREGTTGSRILNRVLRVTIGYGKNPTLAAVESVVAIGCYAVIYRFSLRRRDKPHEFLTRGQALLISIETFVPLLELGAGDVLKDMSYGIGLRFAMAFEKLLGLILVPLWMAAVTGLINIK